MKFFLPLLLVSFATAALPEYSEQAKQAQAALKDGPAAALAAAKLGDQQGDGACAFFLGAMYETGTGVAKDSAAAFRHFQSSSDRGWHEGTAAHARCLELGLGTEKNQAKADHLWQQAAEQNHPHAMARQGIAEEQGLGRPVNLKLARQWYEKAAESQDADGTYYLSRMHAKGSAGLDVNREKAAELAFAAASLGQLDAMNQTGLCYQMGLGVRRDPVAAAGWFNIAAQKDHPAALVNLGQCYEKNLGVVGNLETAARLYAAAAKLNEPSGQYALARLFAEGRGCPKNLSSAFVNFTRSAASGFLDAKDQAARIEALLTPDQKKQAAEILAAPK